MPTWTRYVGVAPGTTTVQFAGARVVHAWDPYARGIVDMRGLGRGLRGLRDPAAVAASVATTSSHVRWDLLAGIGGGALVVALTAGLLAHAL